MIRRRRSLALKIVLLAVLIYFTLFLFLSRQLVIKDLADTAEFHTPRRHVGALKNLSNFAEAGDVSQPVLERLDLDRFRFQEAMQRDAEQAELRKQRLEDEKRHHEEDRRRRAADRIIPPFRNAFPSVVYSDSLNSTQLTQHKSAMSKMVPLIASGLVVVRWDYEKEIPIVPHGPGENGEAVIIDKEKLSPENKTKFDTGWQNNAFNQFASDMISLHRSLPDIRDEGCRVLKYRDVLPDASVVIIFHNEAWSVLIRTVHSVLDRSPPHLVKEVILVDDFSDLDHLKTPLEEYVSKLVKVRVMRNKKREGLIRARLLGSSVATGKVIVFLDSHCECTMGWLEPLLDRIAANWSNVVAPIIDVVSDENLRYQFSSARSTSVGGFDWNLQFNWHPIPERERKRRQNEVDPVWSPTMAGGLFAISRDYFEYIGTYDPGMDIWGGENLELSFRVWMCGGILEQVLCSHVGHIFRTRNPYASHSGPGFLKKNSIRVAEVWLDDYKNYYYDRLGFNLGEYGDVSARKELRKRLNCKSFDWYLKNIFPELFIPGDAVASGEIRNKELGTFSGNNKHPACVDSSVDKNANQQPVKLWPCHNQGGNQFWMLSVDGEMRRDEGCIDYAGQYVMIFPCHGMKGNQEWVYGLDNTLRHRNTNLCLQINAEGTKLEMKPCTGVDRQIWYWKRKESSTTQSRVIPPSLNQHR